MEHERKSTRGHGTAWNGDQAAHRLAAHGDGRAALIERDRSALEVGLGARLEQRHLDVDLEHGEVGELAHASDDGSASLERARCVSEGREPRGMIAGLEHGRCHDSIQRAAGLAEQCREARKLVLQGGLKVSLWQAAPTWVTQRGGEHRCVPGARREHEALAWNGDEQVRGGVRLGGLLELHLERDELAPARRALVDVHEIDGGVERRARRRARGERRLVDVAGERKPEARVPAPAFSVLPEHRDVALRELVGAGVEAGEVDRSVGARAPRGGEGRLVEAALRVEERGEVAHRLRSGRRRASKQEHQDERPLHEVVRVQESSWRSAVAASRA